MTKQTRMLAIRTRAWRSRGWLALALSLFAAAGCGAGPRPAAAPPCDQKCQDGVALLGLRTAMKFAFNMEVNTKPVGAQDGTTPCESPAGSVHVSGMAFVDALQGASLVTLTYDFKNCLFSAPPDPTANQNFSLTMNGKVTENGTISVQPTSTTALTIGTELDDSTMLPTESLSISGSVYDPPLDYEVSSCALSVIQNGNAVSGALCGRDAGFTFD